MNLRSKLSTVGLVVRGLSGIDMEMKYGNEISYLALICLRQRSCLITHLDDSDQKLIV